MVDEHTHQSVLNVVERSIAAEELVAALEKSFALWGGHRRYCAATTGPSSSPKRCGRSARITSVSVT
ncbi:hypothetical protein LQL77_30825 [Rhodococcus cerastii]|nr:hypothetical protein [Rhodococcus cerastii]